MPADPNQPPAVPPAETPGNTARAIIDHRHAEPAAPSLNGMTLAAILEALVARYGWEELGRRIPIGCFNSSPSVRSSLTFLRKTAWARQKVEQLYLTMPREK